MESKFIRINAYIIQKREISWVNIEGTKVTIRLNNKDTVENTTATKEEAQELFDKIWAALDVN